MTSNRIRVRFAGTRILVALLAMVSFTLLWGSIAVASQPTVDATNRAPAPGETPATSTATPARRPSTAGVPAARASRAS